jgi:exodeoxyribonuclease I
MPDPLALGAAAAAAVPTLLWYDYETWGTSPAHDRPAQFAALRTTLDLQPVGEPISLFCKPPLDALPHPAACLVTGLVPQVAHAKGLSESAFTARILAQMAQPGTIAVGYNSMRFDAEVTRYSAWRNLHDPYAHEWQHGCGRWDLLDVMRLAHALRPGGLQWPQRADGSGLTSFKLTDLTAANGLAHDAAHEALSDVRATLALAAALKTAQPKLFDYAFKLHDKKEVLALLGLPNTPAHAMPFVHVSGRLSAERGHCAIVLPLAQHPRNKNELLCWDLAQHPGVLATLSAPEIRQRLFTPAAELPEGVSRLPIKGVHVNKAPMVVPHLRTLDATQAARWGLDVPLALAHAQAARELPDLSAIWAQVYAPADEAPARDVEADLYGGFLSNADRGRLERLRMADAATLARGSPDFDDARLEELAFRWRAREHPHTLSEVDQQRWHLHRQQRLLQGVPGWLTLQDYQNQLDDLADRHARDDAAQELLSMLSDWGDALTDDLF